ncbi:MAG TPA: PH domain-containing protein [Candidatus Saccharibacteria bacterium]|nr:PH domain-containing protein [Candidatus Saccharibacteria bacterium]
MEDPNKPVAYDANGRPLYAAPQVVTPQSNQEAMPSSHVTAAPQEVSGQNYDPQLRAQYSNEPHVVHATRAVEPANKPLSEDIQQRSIDSKKRYPHLNLSEGEFVILDIKRHPIGLLIPVGATALLLIVQMIVLILYPASPETAVATLPSFDVVLWPIVLLMILTAAGGFIAVWVYLQNQFYMTNESVVQEIQHSVFSRHEQTVSLGSIEDASFRQSGFLQTILNYGTIRLSTEGEETTYRFSYVASPRNQVAVLNNAIESFKNGRPVDPYEN